MVAFGLAHNEVAEKLENSDIISTAISYFQSFENVHKHNFLYVDIDVNKNPDIEKVIKPRTNGYIRYLRPHFIHDPSVRLPDFHFNKKGNEQMAQEIFQYFQINKNFLCK